MAYQKIHRPFSGKPGPEKPSPFGPRPFAEPRPFAPAQKRPAPIEEQIQQTAEPTVQRGRKNDPVVNTLHAGERYNKWKGRWEPWPPPPKAVRARAAPPPVPAWRELEYLLDANFLPVAIQAQAQDAVVLKRIGANLESWDNGQIFYAENDTEGAAIHPLPAARINAYWDVRYPSPFARISGPDWRANCADYAIGQAFEDVGPAKVFLASSWVNRGNFANLGELTGIITGLALGEYVAQGANRFIKVIVRGGDVLLRQKDAESGVYEAAMTRSAAATYIFGKSGSGILYQSP
jgi:hypothetical protein